MDVIQAPKLEPRIMRHAIIELIARWPHCRKQIGKKQWRE